MPDREPDILNLEQELEEARLHGRWLGDDERELRAQQQAAQQAALDSKQQQQRKLVILAVVCLLIPPLWPVAVGLTLYLLFPRTTQRLGIAAGIALLSLGVLVAGLITALVVAILMALF